VRGKAREGGGGVNGEVFFDDGDGSGLIFAVRVGVIFFEGGGGESWKGGWGLDEVKDEREVPQGNESGVVERREKGLSCVRTDRVLFEKVVKVRVGAYRSKVPVRKPSRRPRSSVEPALSSLDGTTIPHEIPITTSTVSGHRTRFKEQLAGRRTSLFSAC
jgi:hypothetical protein